MFGLARGLLFAVGVVHVILAQQVRAHQSPISTFTDTKADHTQSSSPTSQHVL